MLLARANARARRPPSEPRESLPCPDVQEYIARQYVKHSEPKKLPLPCRIPLIRREQGGVFIGINAKQHLLIHKAYVKSCI